ncbi:MAG TPA: O-antigen ligase family protein [Polyangiales bacterium]|nr:O-antigen ligase family protein [Polyangiales bacterium]
MERVEARPNLPIRLLSPEPRKRKRRRRFADWHETWSRKPLSTVALGVLLVAAPQLLGGVLPWTINVIAVMSFACLAIVAFRAPALEHQLPRFAVVMLIMTAWTALQATPLPCGFVDLLAHDSVAKQRAIDTLIGIEPSSLCTFSQEPGNTREEILKLLSLTATFIACWVFAASGSWRRLLFLIGGSSVAISAVALLHGVFEWDRVFGVYYPIGVAGNWLLSPLMNSNNLGAFAALGPPLWIGLSYRETNNNLRLFGYVATALTSVVAMASLSRGAIGQLLAGYAVMGWVLLQSKARSSRKEGKPAPAAAGRIGVIVSGVAGLGVGIFMVGNEAVRQFEQGKLDKLDLSAAALRFAGQHAWVGVGRGAFGSAFIGVEGAVQRYRYAENFVVHWLAEWGIPMTLVLLIAIALELIYSVKVKDSLARAGGLTALYLFATQNLVDFGLELLGISTVAVALFAACTAPALEAKAQYKDKEKDEKRKGVSSAMVLAFATMCLGVTSLVWLGPQLARDQVQAEAGELRRLLASSEREAFQAKARRALELHPSEPVLTLLVASEAISHNDPKALAWLNRSMQLAPHWARPHQLAFRWLWQHGQGSQALIELKLAAAIDLAVVMEDACRLGQVNANWAVSVAPNNELRRSYFEQMSLCVAGSPSSRALDRVVLSEYPTSLFPLMHEAERLRQEGRTDESLAFLDRAQLAHRNDHRPTVERFKTLLAAGRLRELLDGIDTAARVLDTKYRGALLEVKAHALARAGSPDLAIQSVEEVRRLAGTNPALLAGSYGLEGDIHIALHQPGEALAAYREAYRINEDTNMLIQVAKVAESLGDRSQALWAYVHWCERDPRGGGCERRNALLSPPSDKSDR